MSRASRRDYRERSKKIPKKTDDLLVIDSRRMWKPISMRFACKPVQAAYNVLMGQILKAERDNFDPNNEDRIESGGAKYVFFGFHPEDDDPEFDGNTVVLNTSSSVSTQKTTTRNLMATKTTSG